MQGPHTSPIVLIGTPEVFLAFKGLHESIILLAVIILGGFILPCPLVRGLLLHCLLCLLLVLCFLGRRFLFLRCGLAVLFCHASTFLFQRVDFCRHGHNLLLFLSRLSPCVFIIQESCLVFVFSRTMRSSAVYVALPSSAWLLRSLIYTTNSSSGAALYAFQR